MLNIQKKMLLVFLTTAGIACIVDASIFTTFVVVVVVVVVVGSCGLLKFWKLEATQRLSVICRVCP